MTASTVDSVSLSRLTIAQAYHACMGLHCPACLHGCLQLLPNTSGEVDDVYDPDFYSEPHLYTCRDCGTQYSLTVELCEGHVLGRALLDHPDLLRIHSERSSALTYGLGVLVILGSMLVAWLFV